MKGVYFVSGIDTDIGKTVATGVLAKQLLQQGKSVITQKPVQTGCKNIAEDIAVHRKIMGIPMQEADKQGLTMPEIFSYPASPHLAARLDGRDFGLGQNLYHHSRIGDAIRNRLGRRCGRIDGADDGRFVDH